ncbi:MAG: TIGR04211 family SH3 domain-containing protein [Gammaproteobacteria bacterium]|nr:TIGR04211 family SH3 domain-containing protein [Gammaproteobacteria bacterium]
MNIVKTARFVSLVAPGILLGSLAMAESAWVSDQFEIMLRTGPSTTNEIRLMLGSGTELEVLERDSQSGYSRVRTTAGTEGWVLTRYLMGEPAAREQLELLTSQLTDATAQGSSLGGQLSAIRDEYDSATQRIAQLEREKEAIEGELAEIRRTAADVLAIDEQNKTLRQKLTDTEIQVDILEQENSDLSAETQRNWFITGALVLFAGVLVGLILPRMRWQRRSGYDRL